MRRGKPQTPAVRSLMIALCSMYSYIYCLMASNALTRMPIFGGALYMCSQVAIEFFSTCMGPPSRLLPKGIRRFRTVILVFLMILNLVLIVIFPLQLSSFQLWTVSVIVLCMVVRDILGRRLVMASATGRLKDAWFFLFLISVHVLPAFLVGWDYLYNLSPESAWPLLWTYGIADLLVLYTQIRERVDFMDVIHERSTPEQAEELQHSLETVNAFRAYQALAMVTVMAMTITVVTVYTYLLISVQEMMVHMALAVGASFLAREACEMGIRLREKRRATRTDPVYMMLLSLVIWMWGLITFRNLVVSPVRPSTLSIYVSLVLCSGGVALCITCLGYMEEAMVSVARLRVGSNLSGFKMLRMTQLDLALLLGEMISLAALTIMCLRSARTEGQMLGESFRPLLLVPAFLMVLASLICTFRFPISLRILDKLNRLLHYREDGKNNRAMEAQVEQMVISPHHLPFGTSFVKWMIRRVYPHKLKGQENIRMDENNPIVFVCNHGDIYGPVICAAYFPVPMRPWVISHICNDADEFAEYFYKYDLKDIRWIPEFLKHPVAKFVGHLSLWCMGELESIPVYRDSPAELIKTFRKSVEAMQAGDNLLIFPENPNAEYQDHGYENSGLGTLFYGFMMLGTVYYKRTKKNCRFVPMYAHKDTRTLCFGEEIDYIGDTEDDEKERHRVVDALEKEMRRMLSEQDAIAAESRRKKHST